MSVCKCAARCLESNVKFHIKLSNPARKKEYLTRLNGCSVSITKRKTSFVVIRDSIIGPLVLCCFFSGHINVTGANRVEGLGHAVTNIAHYFGFRPTDFTSACIDNISSTIKTLTKTRINLFTLSQHIKNLNLKQVEKITYKKQRFPGLFIKTCAGLILWFNSNAITCVGSKSLQEVHQLHNIVLEIKNSPFSHESSV